MTIIIMKTDTEAIRCEWLTEDPVYIKYHDDEWGKPEYDCRRLFEMLCLEGQQAGLSWLTILKKRNSFRSVFHNFDPYRINESTENDIKNILMNPGIVRHKGKIEAIIRNSKCYIEMEKENEDFSEFIWSFVNNKPIINHWVSSREIPTETVISASLSKALKEKGFKFVGPTICYAFMQACGLVNDHIIDCCCRISNIQDY